MERSHLRQTDHTTLGSPALVLVIVVVMLVTVLLAALVLAFVAYPMRGREVPRAGRLNDAIARTAEVLPMIDPDETGAVHVPAPRGTQAGAHRR